MNRREFIGNASLLAALGSAPPALARSKPRRFGIQLWSVAKLLETDFEGTIRWLAALGYRELETFGPYDFSDPRNIAGWQQITPQLGFAGSGLFGRSPAQAARLFRSLGLSVPSLHTDLFTLQTRIGPLAEAAHALGARYVTLPSVPAELRQSLDDYKRAGDALEAVGRDAARHGVRFAYHNHGYGLKPVGSVVPLYTLIEATDPVHVFLEMDTYWTVAGGADPGDLLARYKGRYRMMHLKDMKGSQRFAGDGGGASDWIALFPYLTYLGDGSLDIPAIIAAARKSGVEHFFVEQDRAEDLKVAIAGSAAYLRKIGFR